jgi:hypothetical protein
VDRRDLLRLSASVAAATAATVTAGAPASAGSKPPTTPAPRDIAYRGWTTAAQLSGGTLSGVAVTGDALAIATPAGQRSHTDPHTGTTRLYDFASWTSPQVTPGFAATEVIGSWTADTPGGSWLEIELRGVTQLGNTTRWYVLGRWAADDTAFTRTSLPGQSDTDGRVSVDTFIAASGHGLVSWQLRVTLLRPAGTTTGPLLRSVGAMASTLPAPGSVVASTPRAAAGVVLAVPQYSQSIHAGQYPQWNGGGEAWCSPTSTSMVVAFHGAGPTPADYAWVDPAYADPWVDYAARNTYDASYDGTGNWPFNTAYAGRFGLDGFVTRLRSLNEAEAFIAAGLPLVCSLSFKKNQIPGLTYDTNGHLLVLAGFSASGQPVLNDPASASDALVRKTVGRAEFEAAWLNSSGGVVYVIHPAGAALPPPPAQPNW